METKERAAEKTTTTQRPAIVLLHGFAAHRALMAKLSRRFRAAGYATTNWGYNSWFKPIEFHAAQLREKIAELDADTTIKSIHFVTHSMGCIVTRAALATGLPKKSGRWVMLAPPNKGSFVANRAPRFVKSWFVPVDELQATEGSYVNQLPVPTEIDIAVVQATKDFIVAESLTRIDQEKDRLTVPGLHSQLLFREDVAKQSLHFLEHGRFLHPDAN